MHFTNVAARCAVLLLLASFVPGCDPSSSSPGPASAAPTAGSPTAPPLSVDQVLSLPDTPEERSALSAWALREDVVAEHRVAALRRIEELHAPELLSVATAVARGPAGFARENAVALLVRMKTPEAAAVLATLDPDSQALARSLGGGS